MKEEGRHGHRCVKWDGVLRRDDYKPGFVRARDQLADAARVARWDRVLELLCVPSAGLAANHWRVGASRGSRRCTRPPGTAHRRTRSASSSRWAPRARSPRPTDAPRGSSPQPPGTMTRPAARARAAQSRRCRGPRRPRPTPGSAGRATHPAAPDLRAATVSDGTADGVRAGDACRVPDPGMYGGSSITLVQDGLDVESWSRVVGGSGQAHHITTDATALIDEGFV